ncbi:MAG: hypothetical protein LUC85_06660 [Bacteroidales bacterium]|nr:hypothetical protein [Bacteroidales bacterium]
MELTHKDIDSICKSIVAIRRKFAEYREANQVLENVTEELYFGDNRGSEKAWNAYSSALAYRNRLGGVVKRMIKAVCLKAYGYVPFVERDTYICWKDMFLNTFQFWGAMRTAI